MFLWQSNRNIYSRWLTIKTGLQLFLFQMSYLSLGSYLKARPHWPTQLNSTVVACWCNISADCSVLIRIFSLATLYDSLWLDSRSIYSAPSGFYKRCFYLIGQPLYDWPVQLSWVAAYATHYDWGPIPTTIQSFIFNILRSATQLNCRGKSYDSSRRSRPHSRTDLNWTQLNSWVELSPLVWPGL